MYCAPGLYGLLVQLLLFACCIGTLIAKKVVEGGERTWFQFGLDSSKQLIGAGWIHILNLLCAELLGSQMGQGDECEWYWLNIILDTTLGVLIEYLLLRVLTDALNTVLEEGAQDFRTGSYWRGGEFQVIMYAKQLGLWLVIVTFMKLFMVILMILLAKPLTIAAGVCLKPFMDPLLKLLVVMIATQNHHERLPALGDRQLYQETRICRSRRQLLKRICHVASSRRRYKSFSVESVEPA